MVFNPFRSGIFPLPAIEGKGRPGVVAPHSSDFAFYLKINASKITNSTCTSKSR